MDQLKMFDGEKKMKKCKMKNLIATMRQVLHVWFSILLCTFGFPLFFCALSLSFSQPAGGALTHPVALWGTKASRQTTNLVLNSGNQ